MSSADIQNLATRLLSQLPYVYLLYFVLKWNDGNDAFTTSLL